MPDQATPLGTATDKLSNAVPSSSSPEASPQTMTTGTSSEPDLNSYSQRFGWLGDKASIEDFRLAETKGWNTPNDMLKGYRNLETLLGQKAASYIERPGDNATPEDWQNYWAKLAPKTPEDYKIDDSLKAFDKDPEFSKHVSTWFKEHGIDVKQAQGITQRMSAYLEQAQQREQAEYLTKSKNDFEDFQREHGAKAEEVIELSRRAVRLGVEKAGLGVEQIDAMERVLGTKTVLKLFSTFGSMLREAQSPGSEVSSLAGTPEFAKAQIAKLRSDPEFLKRYSHTDPGIREPAINEMEKWQRQAYGDAPVT